LIDPDGPARRWLALGAVVTAAGLAVAGTAPIVGTAPIDRIHSQQAAGGAVTVLGWALLAWGIHRFGRGA
jgi:hypothetical protein